MSDKLGPCPKCGNSNTKAAWQGGNNVRMSCDCGYSWTTKSLDADKTEDVNTKRTLLG